MIFTLYYVIYNPNITRVICTYYIDYIIHMYINIIYTAAHYIQHILYNIYCNYDIEFDMIKCYDIMSCTPYLY